jgi:hypothetical protein
MGMDERREMSGDEKMRQVGLVVGGRSDVADPFRSECGPETYSILQ